VDKRNEAITSFNKAKTEGKKLDANRIANILRSNIAKGTDGFQDLLPGHTLPFADVYGERCAYRGQNDHDKGCWVDIEDIYRHLEKEGKLSRLPGLLRSMLTTKDQLEWFPKQYPFKVPLSKWARSHRLKARSMY
jgi:hypothetical protein